VEELRMSVVADSGWRGAAVAGRPRGARRGRLLLTALAVGGVVAAALTSIAPAPSPAQAPA
jgi:hypothetical protein